MTHEEITWAGRTLSGTDHFGRWVCEVPDGWWDSPDSKGETADRPGADGEHNLPIYNAARLATFTGLLHAKNHDIVHDAGIFLTGAMTGRLQVEGHGPIQWAEAQRAGKIRFTPLTDKLVQWQVPLKCPDPRKFGEVNVETATPGNDATIFHRGNYTAMPKVKVSGSMPGGYTLGVSGLAFTITRPLLSGTPHVIDYDDGRLRINGLVVHGEITNSFTPGVPAGGTAIVSVSPTTSGTGSAEFTLIDTYI